jgi:actin-related protein
MVPIQVFVPNYAALHDRTGIAEKDCKILMTEPIFSPKSMKINAVTTLFEEMECNSVAVVFSPTLPLYYQGINN